MVVIYIVLALIVFILVEEFIAFKKMFGRHKDSAEPLSPQQGPPYGEFIDLLIEGNKWLESQEKAEHYITTPDGVKLCGTYIHNPKAENKIILLAHGYHAERSKDFMATAPYLYSLGYSLFIIDQRAHGKSGGKYITMSIKERHDCTAWVDYLISQFGSDTRIALYGVSMGAASVLACCGNGLPGNVKCVIADCGFTSAYEMYSIGMKKLFHLPPFPFLSILRLYCRLFAGYDPKADPVNEVIKNSTVPALFLHGKNDGLVPYTMSEKNFAACPAPKRIELFDGADHAQSFFSDEKRYKSLLSQHLSENFK